MAADPTVYAPVSLGEEEETFEIPSSTIVDSPSPSSPPSDDTQRAATPPLNKNVTIQCFACGAHTELKLNHNVCVNLCSAAIYGLASSLWKNAILSAYLKNLFNGRNAPMGRIEALFGVSNLVSAVPVGYLADTQGRAKTIRFGICVVFVAAIAHTGAMWWIDSVGGQKCLRLNQTRRYFCCVS